MRKNSEKEINFNDAPKVDVEALQKEIDEEIVNEESLVSEQDILDKMTYQLSIGKRRKPKDLIEKAKKVISEIQEMVEKQKEISPKILMSEEERDAYLITLNNASLELSRKIKDVTIYYISLKRRVDSLESENRVKRGVDQELSEVLSQMKSYRHYNALSEVDFVEVVRRVIVEIDRRERPKKRRTKKNLFTKSLLLKLLMGFMVVGILLGGYFYKTVQLTINNYTKEKYEQK